MLLLENMEFMSCHVDERKAQSSHIASVQDPYLQQLPDLWETDDTSPCSQPWSANSYRVRQ